MASIEDRWEKLVNGKRIRTERYGQGLRYRARYVDPSGRQRAQSFTRKRDADQFLAGVEGDKTRGCYVDPAEGRRTFGDYAAEFVAHQVQHRATTRAQQDSNLRNHILPSFGNRPLAAIKRSEVQAWVKDRTTVLKPATVETVYKLLATILKSAVRDRLIAATPCDGINLPERARTEICPLTREQVSALAEAVGPRYRSLIITAAGTGLRQGEVFGLCRSRVNFPGRSIRVDQQLQLLPGGPPLLVAPKTPASVRTVPMPDVVGYALAEHIAAYPSDDDLIFTSPQGGGLRRNRFNAAVWARARGAAGLPEGTGFHALRHTYASLLIAAAEHPKTIQTRLGHASITETMDTYGHLFPEAEQGTRAAIDAALGAPMSPSWPRRLAASDDYPLTCNNASSAG